jgi:hypothetical protein
LTHADIPENFDNAIADQAATCGVKVAPANHAERRPQRQR